MSKTRSIRGFAPLALFITAGGIAPKAIADPAEQLLTINVTSSEAVAHASLAAPNPPPIVQKYDLPQKTDDTRILPIRAGREPIRARQFRIKWWANVLPTCPIGGPRRVSLIGRMITGPSRSPRDMRARCIRTLDNTDVVSNVFGAFDRFFVVDTRIHYKATDNVYLDVGVDNLNNDKYFLYHPFPGRTFVADGRIVF